MKFTGTSVAKTCCNEAAVWVVQLRTQEPRVMGMQDLTIAPGPGIPGGLVVVAADLTERFTKSSGPGGQGVNTTDGKVQLSINVAECASLTDAQRHRISRNLEHRLDGSVFTVTASTQRSVFRSWSSRLHLRHSLVPPGRSVRGSTIAPVLITSRDQRVHRRG